jgi:hypothetical protein
MLCSGLGVRVSRTLAAAAVAMATLAAPVCPALARAEHECCCEHDEQQHEQDRLETPPCGCADSAPESHPSHSPAAGGAAVALDVPAAAPSPQLQVPAAAPTSIRPAPARARPPPDLFHIQTVVLRR